MTKAERNQAIIQDYINGLTRQELSLKYNFNGINTVLQKSGIKFNKKGGKRVKLQLEQDRLWINKQILALLKQGFTTDYITQRYNVSIERVVKVKRAAGIPPRKRMGTTPKNISDISLASNVLIPYGDNCTVIPRCYHNHYSQIIYR